MKDTERKRLYAVSNAHLDTQWNWTIKDTIVDCVKNTMEYNFNLFEKYPSYKFNFEGAFRYKLMKEYYPEMYEKVKKYVEKGNWVPVGGAWDSMDVNVPSAESLMRQVLYGNKFFEKEFGKLTEDIFLPDCFGFRSALPSIASHMGLIGFSTQKLVWGVGSPMVGEDGKLLKPQVNKELPRIDLARWKGPDGNEVFTSFLSGNYTYNFDKDGDERPVNERPELEEKIDHNGKYSGVYARNMYYGTGDYGGSCSDGSARLLEDAVKNVGKGAFDVIPASPTQIYHDLTDEEIAAIPVYEGGLLIPHGFGAMTSHTAMKRMNRQNESAADKAERASVMAELMTGAEYPKMRIEGGWKNFLWHQFHDDITGTSIANAYLYSHNDMVISKNVFTKETDNSVANILSVLDTDLAGTPVAVYNPSAFERQEMVTVKLSGKFDSPVVKTVDGKALPTYSTVDGDTTVLTFLPTLKPVSVEVFAVAEGEVTSDASLVISEDTLENENLIVKIDTKGNICSIYDKTLGKELLSAPIREEIFDDNSTVWPSWEYEFKDFQKEPRTVTGDVTVEKLDQRPVSVGFKITVKSSTTTYEKILTLKKGGKGILIDCETDWQDRASLLTIRFPLSAENEKALFDGDLGAELEGNTNTYPYFIHNVHKWADLTDSSGKFGVTVANDCKYAAAKPDNNSLSFVLIHTPTGNFMPTSGQDFQDLGFNKYSFYVEAHKGDKPCINSAVALNNSVIAYETEKHAGKTSGVSFVNELDEGIELRAVKKAEDSEEYVIRLQESYGKAREGVKICFKDFNVKGAVLCNGYEAEIAPIEVKDNSITVDFKRYGVVTVKLALEFDEKTENGVSQKSVELPYNADILCANGETKENQGIYIPREQYPESVTSAGIEYKLSKAEKNVLLAEGQTITLDEGYDSIKFLCAKKKSGWVTFTLDGTPVNIRIHGFDGFVGAREMVVNGSPNKSVSTEIAYIATHTRNEKGEDRVYDFAYLFAHEIPTGGAKTITLPADPELMIFAATQIKRNKVKSLTPMFDNIPGGIDAPKHTLTAKGLRRGSGEYAEGATVLLFAPRVSNNGIFKDFEGEGIISKERGYALVKMGDHDMTVEAVYDYLGENIAENKPCSANHEMNRRESADKALDGKGFTKWCGNHDEKSECTLTIDLEKVYHPKSYLICHAGAIESKMWNTVDFDILVKEKEEDEYIVADSVRGNEDDVTRRDLNCNGARYVMLKIYTPAKDGDTHARIYHFGIFE